MIAIIQQLRKRVFFFFPDSHPVRWLALGPTLVTLTALIGSPLFAHPLLPLIALVSLLTIWLRQDRGRSISLSLFAAYGLLALFLGQGGWELILQEAAFILAVGVAALSFNEVTVHEEEQKRRAADEILTLKRSVHALEEKQAAKERQVEKQRAEFDLSLQEEREKVIAFSQLVEASQNEAAKSFAQSEALSAQALQLQQDGVRLQQRLKEETAALKELQRVQGEERTQLRKRLDALNWYRVEYFQMQLFLEEEGERFHTLKEFILKRQKDDATSFIKQEESACDKELKHLEEKKNQAKKAYDQEFKEWKKIEEKIKRLQRKLDRANQVEEIAAIEGDKRRIEEERAKRKKSLEALKAEYIEIEREIFLVRKELQHQGAFAG